MNDVSPFIFGQAQFRACQLAHDFINMRVRPRVTEVFEAAPTAEATAFAGALLRVLGWTFTLSRLDHPGYFQAGIVATRTLFEIAVDVVLMHFEPQATPHRKLLAWEDSAKLKAAVRIRNYFQRRGEPPTLAYEPHIQFIEKHEARVLKLRDEHWNGKHPNRWTGRSLEQDAQEADRLFAAGRFEAFYETRYPHICWNTHGSGIAGVRNVTAEHFPALSGLAFGECTGFALVAAEIVLREFALWSAELAVEFDDHRKHRIDVAYATMAGA